MEKEKIKIISENEIEFRGERYIATDEDTYCSNCDLRNVCGQIDWLDSDDVYMSCFVAWKKAKKKHFKQIIKCFRTNEDFLLGKPMNISMPVNENEENSENFTKHLLCGVAWGLTARFSKPVAAVYSVDENGNEKFISSMHAYRSTNKKRES